MKRGEIKPEPYQSALNLTNKNSPASEKGSSSALTISDEEEEPQNSVHTYVWTEEKVGGTRRCGLNACTPLFSMWLPVNKLIMIIINIITECKRESVLGAHILNKMWNKEKQASHLTNNTTTFKQSGYDGTSCLWGMKGGEWEGGQQRPCHCSHCVTCSTLCANGNNWINNASTKNEGLERWTGGEVVQKVYS